MVDRQCPQCSNVIDVPDGTQPVCPSCGFGGAPLGHERMVEYPEPTRQPNPPAGMEQVPATTEAPVPPARAPALQVAAQEPTPEPNRVSLARWIAVGAGGLAVLIALIAST